MSNFLSNCAKTIEPSATIAVDTRSRELKAQGYDIISLGVGEPDFDTPEFIKEAGIAAIKNGYTKYTAVSGIEPLKKAIIHKLQRDNQLSYALKQIIVSAGTKQALYNLLLATVNPGDEVIIPAPYWTSYPTMVKLAGGIPVIVKSDFTQNFKISADQLAKAITPKTKLFILNSPNNPTGMVYHANELKALAEVLSANPQILIAADDIYEYIYWGKEPYTHILNVAPQLADRTIVLNGASKSYAMTGWRIGFSAGPTEIIQAMEAIQSQTTSCPTSISQYAATTAFDAPQSEYDYIIRSFADRYYFAFEAISRMKKVSCQPSEGAFYIFMNVTKAMAAMGVTSDVEFSTELLTKHLVSVVPGTAFGMPGYIRISFATSLDKLKEAIKRLQPVLD